MARSKSKKKQEVDDTEYTVEAIKDHDRKGKLRYFVKWKGYDKPSDNTWEPEEEIKSITQVVEKYWKSKKPEERLERYKVNSKEYKALQAELLEGEDEEEQEEGEEEEEEEEEDKKKKAKKGRGKSSGAGKKRKSSEQANGSSSSKKAKKEKSEDEVEETEKEGEVNGVENGNGEEALEAGSEGWDSGTRALIPWKEISENQKLGGWEDLILKIDTVEKDENSKTEPQGVKMLCIWHKVNHDGDHFESWVPAAISRKTCPQKMLDFFLSNLKFRTTDGLTEEDMAKLAEEEAAEAGGGGEERQDSPAHGEVEL